MALRKTIFLSLSIHLLLISIADGQGISPGLSKKEKAYANAIFALSSHFVNHPTPIDTAHPGIDSVANFYDKIIDDFFCRDRMKLEFRNSDTNYYNVAAKFYLQRASLNIMDLWLDRIPLDSLSIISAKSSGYIDPSDFDQYNNSVSLTIGKQKLVLLMVWFDEKTDKMISMLLCPPKKGEILQLKKYFQKSEKL